MDAEYFLTTSWVFLASHVHIISASKVPEHKAMRSGKIVCYTNDLTIASVMHNALVKMKACVQVLARQCVELLLMDQKIQKKSVLLAKRAGGSPT